MSTLEILLYNKVQLDDDSQGIIRYMGGIMGKKGIFYGVDITKGDAKNDGTFKNIKYFDTKKGIRTGRFCKETKIIKCKKTTFSKYPFKLGDIVMCTKTKCKGIIKYVGVPSWVKGGKVYYGLELHKKKGTCNGSNQGVQYFQAKPGCGIYVPAKDIKKVGGKKKKKKKKKKKISTDSVINLNHLLISGYLRKDFINVSNSPQVIIQIIIEYMYYGYGLNNHIVIFTKYRDTNTYTDLSDIKMVDITNEFKEYSFQFKNGSLKHDCTSAYYVSYDIHPNLKKHLNEKYVDSNINSFIIRCGGIERYRSRNFASSTMILFDSKQVESKNNDSGVIDGYIHNEGNGSCMNAVLYDKYNNILVSVGGVYYEDDDGWFYDEKDCIIYDFNQHKTLNGYNGILPKCLQHPCVSILDIEKKEYLISGGYENRCGVNKLCYKLDANIKTKKKKKVTELSAMNEARFGHCATNLEGKYKNQIIIAGGGGAKNDDISKSAEIYNIEKNKWTLMKQRTNYEHRCGTIWSDKNNSNIVYIAGSISNKSGIATSWDRTLGGFIEYKDLRDNEKWNKIMIDKNNPFNIKQQYKNKNNIYSIIV